MNTISEAYREQNAELHARMPEYGTSGSGRRNNVRPLAAWGRKAILDYGCGKETLAMALGPAYSVTGYDPCIAGKDVAPAPHPVVVCGDVLEHIEPEFLDNVLADLRRLTLEKLFVSISIAPSQKTLADGRNAHLIVEPPEWWAGKLSAAGFEILETKPAANTKNTTWMVLQ